MHSSRKKVAVAGFIIVRACCKRRFSMNEKSIVWSKTNLCLLFMSTTNVKHGIRHWCELFDILKKVGVISLNNISAIVAAYCSFTIVETNALELVFCLLRSAISTVGNGSICSINHTWVSLFVILNFPTTLIDMSYIKTQTLNLKCRLWIITKDAHVH